jgi:hypothetical protein
MAESYRTYGPRSYPQSSEIHEMEHRISIQAQAQVYQNAVLFNHSGALMSDIFQHLALHAKLVLGLLLQLDEHVVEFDVPANALKVFPPQA